MVNGNDAIQIMRITTKTSHLSPKGLKFITEPIC